MAIHFNHKASYLPVSRSPGLPVACLLSAVCCLALLLTACGAAGVTQTATTQSYRVALTLDAARFGDRSATVELRDQAGAPVDGAQVVLSPTMPTDGMASPEASAQPLGNGRYQAGTKLAFTMLGEWQIDVRISAAGKEEVARFVVKISE